MNSDFVPDIYVAGMKCKINPDFAIGKCAADAPACRAQMATAQAGGGAGSAV